MINLIKLITLHYCQDLGEFDTKKFGVPFDQHVFYKKSRDKIGEVFLLTGTKLLSKKLNNFLKIFSLEENCLLRKFVKNPCS